MPTIIATGMLGSGVPHHCPICRRWVWVEPSYSTGDAPCPACGCLLWPRHRPPTVSAHRRASPARRLGHALQRAWRRARWPSLSSWLNARPQKPVLTAHATTARRSGVWDPWLDK